LVIEKYIERLEWIPLEVIEWISLNVEQVDWKDPLITKMSGPDR
jgi:hypothetical protein